MCKRLLAALTLVLMACSSDSEIICEKFDECNVLNPGVSVDSCVESVEKESTESARSDCAECVDEKSCGSLVNGACDAECGG